MIRNFREMMEKAQAASAGLPPRRVAVCAAEDESSVQAMESLRNLSLVEPILIGDRKAILEVMAKSGIDTGPYTIHDVGEPGAKAAKGVELIRQGAADILMKGLIPTSTFLHPIFRRETGLLTGNFISHVGVLEVPGFERLILQTDGGINIAPDIEMKKGIIMNAVFVARRVLDIERPKVALLSASEKVHPKIPSTVEARDLALWARDNVPDADVEGPMALDLAVSVEAAMRKGMGGAVAGRADVLVSPNIEMGNVIYKALRYFAGAQGAGLVVGAACPIMLTSRSDPPEEKINSLALAVLYAMHIKEAGYKIKKETL
jgi:phosphate butyryltransferase